MTVPEAEVAEHAARLAARADQVALCLRVAAVSAEAPERLLADADLVVDGPSGLRDFLRMAGEPLP